LYTGPPDDIAELFHDAVCVCGGTTHFFLSEGSFFSCQATEARFHRILDLSGFPDFVVSGRRLNIVMLNIVIATPCLFWEN
jgi:hypothetical protein